MRRKSLGFIAFFLSLSIYFSCIDEGVDVSGGYQQAPETELLAYAKKLVGENGEGCSLIDLQKGNPGSRAVTDYSTVATPLWEKAKTERHGDEEVLVVPLQSEEKIHSSMYFEEEHKDRLYRTQTFSRLVIRKKNCETYSQVFTYLPSRHYAKNRQEVLDTMGFSPLVVKYYGTILISGLDGKFQQGFFYERGVPTIHFTKHKHSDSVPVLIFNDSTATEECHEHSHANSFSIRLNLSGNPAVASRSYEEGDEDILADYCPACGSTDPEHSCTIVDGSHLLCPECKKLKENCVCLPTMTRCPVCDKYYCECFEPCPDCYSYPCICGGNGSNNGNGSGDNLGGGTSGGGNGIGGGNSEHNPNINSDENITRENFIRLVHNKRLEENVRTYLRIEPDSNYIQFDNGIIENPSTNAIIYNKKILISNSIFWKKYSIGELESIVFHEYVHLTQPEANMTDVITKEIPYADFEIEKAKKDFYKALMSHGIPVDDNAELTIEQESTKISLWQLFMEPYVDAENKPKSRYVSYNYQYCINEKEAYTLQLQVYGHEMTIGNFKSEMIYQNNYFSYLCEQLIK